MGVFTAEGEMVEGKKCEVSARKFIFKKGGLRKDPITDQNMVLYELDRNCDVMVMESLNLSMADKQRRIELGVHGEVGDLIRSDAIRLYVDSRRDILRPDVVGGYSGRHSANVVRTNVRTIGRIKTPLSIYNNLLGYSANSNNNTIENQ